MYKILKTNVFIPVEITQLLDSIHSSEYESSVDNFIELYNDWTLPKKLHEFCDSEDNFNLCLIYLIDSENSFHFFARGEE